MTCTLDFPPLPVRLSRRFDCVGDVEEWSEDHCLGPGPNNCFLKTRLNINEFRALRSLFGKQALLRRLGALLGLGCQRYPILSPLKLKGLLGEFADIRRMRVPLG